MSHSDDSRLLNFTNDVVPMLSKQGCNSGACHGKAIGQNGFKLSLFGFDPQFDYASLVHEGHGRRVSPAAPEDSLVLLKVSGGMPHGGGVRLPADSAAYRLLRRWIEQGMPWGRDQDPHDVKLEVFPNERELRGRAAQQLRVVAHYSDGSARDVTPMARYDTQTAEILTVSSNGLVEMTGRAGEGYIMVRYGSQAAMARIVSLRGPALSDNAYALFKPKNFVDELVLAKWRRIHLPPSAEAGDEEFLRRVFLDAMGTLPTPKEVREFVSDTSLDKRDQLVDRVVERDEYIDLWAHRMGDMLRNHVGDSNAKDDTIAFAKWIRKSVTENKPFDQFVREILAATGKRSDHPQMEWYRWASTSENRVEDTAQAFLGKRVSCANCHDHPFENVRQSDYWQFAAFFARVKLIGEGHVNEIKVNDNGEVKHPRTEQKLAPKAFGGPQFDDVKGEDPRQKLVAWMTAPENPYFARAICNRVWGHYLGIGLVDPVDDMRTTNPASNPQLLDALARDFVEHKFDLKHLMKTIMKSRVYGLSSTPLADNRTDSRNYARYYSRRLPPHVLMDAIASATGVGTKFDDYPDIKKAVHLPNEKGRSDFLDVFGRSERGTPCECETSLAPNLPQVLYLLNSDELQKKLSDKNGTVAELTKSDKPSNEIVEELFLRTFSRRPRPSELEEAVKLIENSKGRHPGIEDLLWALLNSKEFLFNH